jgi:hypothetical protein
VVLTVAVMALGQVHAPQAPATSDLAVTDGEGGVLLIDTVRRGTAAPIVRRLVKRPEGGFRLTLEAVVTPR